MSLENEVKRLLEEKRKKKAQAQELKNEENQQPACIRCGALWHMVMNCKRPK